MRTLNFLRSCPHRPKTLTLNLLVVAVAFSGTVIAETGSSRATQHDQLPQIIGGAPAANGRYPWLVALVDADVLANSDPFLAQYCAGTLISGSWVLTAAHCLLDEALTSQRLPPQIKILVGTQDLLSPEGQLIDAARLISHPDFAADVTNVEADIGLIQLATPVSIDPLPLNRLADNPMATEDTLAWIAGWGLNGTPSDFPKELHEAQIPLLSLATCRERYTTSELNILDSHLCAGFAEGGVDTCVGDSGGPIFLSDEEGIFLQLGITSAGEGCASTFPGIYTQISSYISWIDENTTSNLYFAQFGDGQGFSSEVVLFNPSSIARVRGSLIFRSGSGEAVDPASFLSSGTGLLDVEPETDFDLAPLGSLTLTTTGTSTELVSGSAEVISDGAIAGIIRFRAPGVGVAGVGSSSVASSLIAPVQRRGTLSTGVALHNTLQSEVVVDLTLKHQDGTEVVNGSSQLTIPAQGHSARFLQELFPDADTQDFEGTICVRSTNGKLAVVAIEQGSGAGEFTTLPVSVLDGN